MNQNYMSSELFDGRPSSVAAGPWTKGKEGAEEKLRVGRKIFSIFKI
jgi:hypothetical protein